MLISELIRRPAIYTFDAPTGTGSGNDVVIKGSARDLEEMRLAQTMYREEANAKKLVENELKLTKDNWDVYRKASERMRGFMSSSWDGWILICLSIK